MTTTLSKLSDIRAHGRGKRIAPVDVYRILQDALDEGRLGRDHLPELSRRIAALTISETLEETA